MKLKSLIISGLFSVGALAGGSVQVFSVGTQMSLADRVAAKNVASSSHRFTLMDDLSQEGRRLLCQFSRMSDNRSTAVSCDYLEDKKVFLTIFDDPSIPVSTQLLDYSRSEDQVTRGVSIALRLFAIYDT